MTTTNPPVVLHIPHSSRIIPPEIRKTILLSDSELESELLKMTDLFVDELFTLNDSQAIKIVFPHSRLVVDPERFLDDAEELMTKVGMGVIYLRSSTGKLLRNALFAKERHELIVKYYIPHHERLESVVENALSAHGKCLIVDCHSFSSIPLPHEPDQTPNRPDICLGIDIFHTPDWLFQAAKELCFDQGFRVELNRPFSGTIVPLEHYNVSSSVCSIMIEVNRSLYMNEKTGARLPDFEEIKAHINSILLGLSQRARLQS